MTDEISNLTQVIRNHSECELDYGTLKTLTMIDAESKLRDAEIKKLKYQVARKVNNIFSQQAEIETFKIISSKQYDKIENLEAEIKKLRETLKYCDKISGSLIADPLMCIRNKCREALKDGK